MIIFRIGMPMIQPVCVADLILYGNWTWNGHLLPLLVRALKGL